MKDLSVDIKYNVRSFCCSNYNCFVRTLHGQKTCGGGVYEKMAISGSEAPFPGAYAPGNPRKWIFFCKNFFPEMDARTIFYIPEKVMELRFSIFRTAKKQREWCCRRKNQRMGMQCHRMLSLFATLSTSASMSAISRGTCSFDMVIPVSLVWRIQNCKILEDPTNTSLSNCFQPDNPGSVGSCPIDRPCIVEKYLVVLLYETPVVEHSVSII